MVCRTSARRRGFQQANGGGVLNAITIIPLLVWAPKNMRCGT